ncbi:hypothetical protein ABR738_19030 [Streptomyces sp. Edi4]|uniref:hypothetical protein n=1 Tax=Streptomyces sp. Edi4 TaxID=3162527 RepID=UPI0033060315
MPTPLPIPIEFRLPEGWVPARPELAEDVAFAAVHPQPDAGFAANITIAGEVLAESSTTLVDIADESVGRLREAVGGVEVEQRGEAGAAGAPALTQRLTFSATVNGIHRELVQTQAYMSLPGIEDPASHVVIRLALTATAAQHDEVLEDFQDLIRSVHSDSGTRAQPWAF